MTKSPFKFLDSYTKDDKDIFFGRDREIEEMYQKVFESKMLLVYGISGTGKTSLINCGLANKFEDSDWLPVSVRRGRSVGESLWRELGKVALSELPPSSAQADTPPRGGEKPARIVKTLQSIYLDHFKPIYLIFDQFEELFIFGDREERDQFIQIVKAVVDSDVQCRFIFSIREEYLAGVTEFERLIPEFLANRMRIEKMTSKNAIQVIEGPCNVHGIEVEEGFPETVLEKLSPESTEIELTYLQVFLDKAFRLATDKDKEKPGFTNELLEQVGDVSDLLGSFLEEQISQLDDPETGLTILKSFVSIKGTKRQISEEEIIEFSQTLGNPVERDELKDLIQKFINLRILRDKDESGRYELRHDGLATKIYEKITLVEKELLEVRQFIDNAYSNYEKRYVYLNVEDLKYIAPYEDKLFLNQRLEKFINDSKREVQKAKRRRRNIAIAAAITLIVVLSGFSIWALNERTKAIKMRQMAIEQKNVAIKANEEVKLANELALSERNKAIANEKLALNAQDQAEKSRNEAINAKEIVTGELYSAIRNSLSVSPVAMNVLYFGISNPLNITASAIETNNLFVEAINGEIVKGSIDGFGGNFIVSPTNPSERVTIIKVKGITNKKDTIKLGNKEFRVLRIPDPLAYIGNKSGGLINKEMLVRQQGVQIKLIGFLFDIQFQASGFEIIFSENDTVKYVSENALFTIQQKIRMRELKHGDKIKISNIKAHGPDGRPRRIAPIEFKIK